MLWLLLPAALAASPADQVAALFPGAGHAQIGPHEALAPIKRHGEVGYILLQDISAVPVDGGRTLVAFRLQTAKTSPDELAAAVRDVPRWTRVLQVVLLDANGKFLSKPAGFPMEKSVNTECVGDLCDFGPSGHLEGVKGSSHWAVLHWRTGVVDDMGRLEPLQVEGDAVTASEDVLEGSGGGATGCEWTVAYQDLHDKDGALRATKGSSCDGTGPGCAALCKANGYPLEQTLQPVTLGR